jgi:inactive STAND
MSREKIELLERRYAELLKQVEIAENELLTLDNDVSYHRKEQEIDRLYDKIESTQNRIQEAEKSFAETIQNPAESFRIQSKKLDRRLRQIDCKKARKSFDDICRKFDEQGGGALFLLNEAHTLQGKLSIEEMCDKLSEFGGDWRSYTVGFAPGDIQDIKTLSQRLCQSFQQQEFASMEEFIDLICGSLQIGTTLFWEIQDLDNSPESCVLLDWFVREFWIPLLAKRHEVCQKHQYENVRFFAAITCSGNGKSFLKTPYRGKPKQFNPLSREVEGAIVPLPLEKWTELDLKTWLKTDPPPQYARNPSALENCARTIYQKSGGIPIAVVPLLEDLYLNRSISLW